MRIIIRGIFYIILIVVSAPLVAQHIPTIHVMVALCDNKYQGIVKVPKGIGNGQDPNTNLYWGCGYGIRTFFKNSTSWKEVKRYKVDDIKLERIIFKHKKENIYLVADAYDGRHISDCTIDFLKSCSGLVKDTLNVSSVILGINGNAKLVSYIGHNGLMDFSLPNIYKNEDGNKRDAIILACASKQYFSPYLRLAGASPVLWTTHLMCPEAYTIHDALEAYIKGQKSIDIRDAAAIAYNKYQKCGLNGAKKLLVTGF